MKIAVYYYLNFGGAKRVVMDHVKGLKKRGHIVDLYTINHEEDVFDPAPHCRKSYFYSFNFNTSWKIGSRFARDYKNLFTLKKLHRQIAADIDKRKYDIVLVHPDKSTQSPFLLRYLKTPSVYYCQEPLRIVYEYSMRLRENVGWLKYFYEELTRYYRKRVDRQNVRSATYTIASCYHIRERMIESYEVYPKVVYCAVDKSVFRPMKLPKKNQIFYVGSPVVWEDGYDLARDAIALIPKNIRPDLNVISWRNENGDRLSEDELVTIYNQSLMTLCTSRLETFGLVPLESMACGVPVIATKLSGHRETVIDGKTGFLVELDAKDIAEKIMLLMSDRKLARKIGESGRDSIKHIWNWEVQVKNLEKVLSSFVYESKNIKTNKK